MTLAELRQEIERLDAAATKGPLTVVHLTTDGSRLFPPIAIQRRYIKDKQEFAEVLRGWLNYADAAFIAFARTALPELLRRLIVAEGALESIAESGWGIKTNPTATNALAEIRGNEASGRPEDRP